MVQLLNKGAIMKRKKILKENAICPICGQTILESEYDICKICYWENDDYQRENPNSRGGANNLSLNDYKKWWNTLEKIMPNIQKKYNIKTDKRAGWKYDEMIIPRKNLMSFIHEMTDYNIELRASFYNICDRYNLDRFTFVGFPLINAQSVKENNDEIINIVFSKDPINICNKYKMKQMLEILQEKENVLEVWESFTPNICIMPNPTHLINFNI